MLLGSQSRGRRRGGAGSLPTLSYDYPAPEASCLCPLQTLAIINLSCLVVVPNFIGLSSRFVGFPYRRSHLHFEPTPHCCHLDW